MAELTDTEIEQSHRLDDLEKKRTRLVREARQAVDLLDTALHALRNGRVHVTDEHVDRALDHLMAGLVAQTYRID